MQFFYSATNGSDTGSVVAAVVGNEATANLSDLLPATTYTVYGVVTATNGSTPQSSSTTFTTEGARTDHAAWYELPAKDNAGSNMLLRTFYDTARNYTMFYDTSTYTAYWVAYPLRPMTWDRDVRTIRGLRHPGFRPRNKSMSGPDRTE